MATVNLSLFSIVKNNEWELFMPSVEDHETHLGGRLAVIDLNGQTVSSQLNYNGNLRGLRTVRSVRTVP